ncbi:DUF58 domain-containing protein [Carboxylicivirga mesophila]|uniref:DUF58 domain-containing protein n=1 Tax=Carboxylicivirga mesophila TaxID=1166478 RepID=A0ABS5KBS4_9BACT|nr:DUF58 domain-containing protein [Carboxylicivirga mesophila]MBS2212480.1 DUF58 domain-containing protein [Carboxylicivirga mesophila]
MQKQHQIPVEVAVTIEDLMEQAEYVDAVNFSSKQPQRSALFGRHRSLIHGRGLDFDQVRKYVRGDDVRYIDWKVTARTQKTHLKQYTEERERPVLLVVNQSSSMFFGTAKNMKSVVAAKLAAIVAHHIVKEKDRLGAIIFNDEEAKLIRPKGGQKNLVQIMQKLTEVNQSLVYQTYMADNKTVLTNTMTALHQLKPVNHLIVFISDFLHYLPEVKSALASVSRHNDVVLFKVNDPMEFTMADEKWVLSQQELQLLYDGTKERLNKGYAEDTVERYQSFSDQMLKHGIPVLKFDTITPVQHQLSDYFK